MVRKQHELLELDWLSFQPLISNKKPLCSNCHTPGHNKGMCSFAPYVLASICNDIKRHHEEKKHDKAVQFDLKSQDQSWRTGRTYCQQKGSLASRLNTYATKVQAPLKIRTEELEEHIANKKIVWPQGSTPTPQKSRCPWLTGIKLQKTTTGDTTN